jgi:uncharacterized membrane protein
MDGSVEYTIPVWHPTLVHFPIALLLLGVVPAVVWCLTTDRRWLLAGWFIAVVGVVGTLAAYLTGDTMVQQAEGVPIVEALVGTHERFAIATLIASIVSAVAWSGVALADRAQIRRAMRRATEGDARRATEGDARRATLSDTANAPSWPVRLLVLALATAAAVLVVRTGHIGGLMVWGVPVP